MAERLMVAHTTVWRWCQSYGPMIYQRLRGKLKYTTTTWHMDEPTFELPAGGCIATAHQLIQGIEAVHMIRKAQLLESQRTNLATTSIAFALLLKIA